MPSLALELLSSSLKVQKYSANWGLRRVRMTMLILRCIRFGKLFENLQHKICGFSVVLVEVASCDSQMLPVFFMLKKSLVPSRNNSRLLFLQESIERR